jgi:uncharacterized membrane protein (DUF2068 family)
MNHISNIFQVIQALNQLLSNWNVLSVECYYGFIHVHTDRYIYIILVSM